MIVPTRFVRLRSRRWLPLVVLPLLLAAAPGCGKDDGGPAAPYWAARMKEVHARFKGPRGTFATFGDSITASDAFWARLRMGGHNMSPETARDYGLVRSYMLPECWDKWKGEKYGNDGGTDSPWAVGLVGDWLKRLNPEVAVIMFGTNDFGGRTPELYAKYMRIVVERCLENGTIVILTTAPPTHSHPEQARRFAAALRQVAVETEVPLIDYFEEVMQRRPTDWDGTLPQFRDVHGDEYQVPTLISRDGVHPSNPELYSDFGPDGLNNNGYLLRTYLTLRAYAEVIRTELQPSWYEGSEIGRWFLTLLQVLVVVGAAGGVVYGLECGLNRAGR
jgi:lysophospholipase L1-like esterase